MSNKGSIALVSAETRISAEISVSDEIRFCKCAENFGFRTKVKFLFRSFTIPYTYFACTWCLWVLWICCDIRADAIKTIHFWLPVHRRMLDSFFACWHATRVDISKMKFRKKIYSTGWPKSDPKLICFRNIFPRRTEVCYPTANSS